MLELIYRFEDTGLEWKHQIYITEEERDSFTAIAERRVDWWKEQGRTVEFKIVEAPLRTIKTMWRYRNEDDWIEETLTEWNPHRIKEIRKKMRVFGKRHRRAGDKEYRWRIVEVED